MANRKFPQHFGIRHAQADLFGLTGRLTLGRHRFFSKLVTANIHCEVPRRLTPHPTLESGGHLPINNLTVPLRVLLAVLLCALCAYRANRKGYNWLLWVGAGGVVGIIMLVFLPDASISNLPEDRRRRRRSIGNVTGAGLSVLALLYMLRNLLS